MSGKRRRGSSSTSDAVLTSPGAAPASAPSSVRSRASTSASISIFGYQEIFLRVMSFLSPTDLAMAQGVSRQWATMSLDPQLWKRLYLERYPHPHQSRLIYKGAASTPSRSMRPIARMPSRAFPPPSPTRTGTPTRSGSQTPEMHEKRAGIGQAMPLSSRVEQAQEVGYGVRNDGVDWKMMLRLGTNWSNGNALSETSVQLPPSPAPSSSSGMSIAGPARPTSSSATSTPPPYSEQHIALFPSFIATSNPTSPLVHIHRSSINATTAPLGIIPPPPGWSSPHRPDNVTSISADQSVVLPDDSQMDDGGGSSGGVVLPARLGIFYQSGGFAILRVTLSAGRLSWSREAVHPPHMRPRSVRRRPTTYTPLDGDPIVLTAIHYPIVITCTLAFHLSFYTLMLPTDGGASMGVQTSRPVHIGTMHSDVSFHPAALSLFPAGTSVPTDHHRFRAALTYCTPLYPYSWTVAVQEFHITAKSPSRGADITRGECWHVGRGDEDEPEHIWPRKIRPIVGVKGRPVGVGTDGRWAVLAGEDNQIQVYSLPTSTSSSTVDRRSYPISHSHTLLAHSAAITSIFLASGRVVSGGRDGRVLVWELDEDLEHEDPLRGRTVAYVEVRPGGRRSKWRGAAGPDEQEPQEDDGEPKRLPHPQSISSAARSLFLPRLPEGFERRDSGRERDVIRQLAFDEEKIVGLVKEGQAEVMKVWGFNG